MDWCRVVGPRGLCGRSTKSKQFNLALRPGQGKGKGKGKVARWQGGKRAKGQKGKRAKGQKGKRAKGQKGKRARGQGGNGATGQGGKGARGQRGKGARGQGGKGARGQGQGQGQATRFLQSASLVAAVPPQTPNTDQKHANGSGFGVLIITD